MSDFRKSLKRGRMLTYFFKRKEDVVSFFPIKTRSGMFYDSSKNIIGLDEKCLDWFDKGLEHELLHKTIYELIGREETKAFDNITNRELVIKDGYLRKVGPPYIKIERKSGIYSLL